MIFSSREGFCLLTPKVWGSPQSNCNALRGLASPTSGSPLFLGCRGLRDIHQAYPRPLFLEGLIPNCCLQLWQSLRRVATRGLFLQPPPLPWSSFFKVMSALRCLQISQTFWPACVLAIQWVVPPNDLSTLTREEVLLVTCQLLEQPLQVMVTTCKMSVHHCSSPILC